MFIPSLPHVLFLFFGLFIIVALVVIGISVWLSSARRSRGPNSFVAGQQPGPRLSDSVMTPPPFAGRTIEQRLAELADLHARGVITDSELTAGRAAIIGGG